MTCIKTSMVNHTQYTDATQDGLRAEMFVKRLFPHVTDYKKKIYFWNSLRWRLNSTGPHWLSVYIQNRFGTTCIIISLHYHFWLNNPSNP